MISRNSLSSLYCSFPFIAIFVACVACMVPACEEDKTDCQVVGDLSLECDGALSWADCDQVDEELVAYVAEADGCEEYLARELEARSTLACDAVERWRDECDPEGSCPLTCSSYLGDQERLWWVETCDDFWLVCDSTPG